MQGLEVPIPCECGQLVAGTSKNAGGAVVCRCGRSVPVPRLSKLRLMAGAEAYATNPADTIRAKVANGNSPGSTGCIVCSVRSAPLYECIAVCESSHSKNSTSSDSIDFVTAFIRLAAFLVLPVTIFFHRKPEDAEIRGHDVQVEFTFRLCDMCKTTAGNLSHTTTIKTLLSPISDYQKLIHYYPDVKFTPPRVIENND